MPGGVTADSWWLAAWPRGRVAARGRFPGPVTPPEHGRIGPLSRPDPEVKPFPVSGLCVVACIPGARYPGFGPEVCWRPAADRPPASNPRRYSALKTPMELRRGALTRSCRPLPSPPRLGRRFCSRAAIFGIQGGLEVERVSEVEPDLARNERSSCVDTGQPVCAFCVD